jgi:hypothetical protein
MRFEAVYRDDFPLFSNHDDEGLLSALNNLVGTHVLGS